MAADNNCKVRTQVFVVGAHEDAHRGGGALGFRGAVAGDAKEIADLFVDLEDFGVRGRVGRERRQDQRDEAGDAGAISPYADCGRQLYV